MIDTPAPATPALRPAGRRVLLVALVPLAAVTWWLVGALPELLDRVSDAVTGLGEQSTDPWNTGSGSSMTTLPLAGASLGLLVPNSLLGGLLAGLLGRLARGERRATVAGATLGGLALALTVVLLGAAADPEGLASFPFGTRYGAGLVAGMVLATLAGWFLGSCALVGRSGTGIALGAVAGALPVWLGGLALAVVDVSSLGPSFDLRWTAWVGAAFLALALVIVGVEPLPRLAWWPLVVVVTWTVLPLVWAAAFQLIGAGSTVPHLLWDGVLNQARQIFPWLVPVVVAAGVSLLRSRASGADRPS